MDARQSGWAKLPRKPEVQHENAQKPSAPADPSASCSAGLRGLYDSGGPFQKPKIICLRHAHPHAQADRHAHHGICHWKCLHRVPVHHQQHHRYALPAGYGPALFADPHSGVLCGGFGQLSGGQCQRSLCGRPCHYGRCCHRDLQLSVPENEPQRSVRSAYRHGADLVLFQHPDDLDPCDGPQRVRHAADGSGRQLFQCQFGDSGAVRCGSCAGRFCLPERACAAGRSDTGQRSGHQSGRRL